MSLVLVSYDEVLILMTVSPTVRRPLVLHKPVSCPGLFFRFLHQDGSSIQFFFFKFKNLQNFTVV